jgi:RNA polymerase sigma factor (sigma-70 family)
MSDEQVRQMQAWISSALLCVNNLHYFVPQYIQADDMKQEMFLYVWTQLPKYDPDRASLRTFVHMKAICAAQRQMYNHRNMFRNDPLDKAYDLPSPHRAEDTCFDYSLLEQVLRKRSDKVREIVAYRARGMKLREIAQKVGSRVNYVSRCLNQVKDDFEHLNAHDYRRYA